MNDEEFLEGLSAHARTEREDEDPRLAAYARRALSPEAIAALESEAAEDPDLAYALALYRPLDDEAQDRMAAKVVAEMAPVAKVLPFRRRPIGRLLMVVAPLAAAAALAFFVLRPGPVLPPIPGYALAFEGGEKTNRGDGPEAAVPRLLPDSRLRIVLTPAAEVTGTVTARAFVAQGQRVEPWPAPIQLAATGALRIEGPVAELKLPDVTGRWRLIVVVGRAEALPDAAEALGLAARPPRYGPLRAVSVEVELAR